MNRHDVVVRYGETNGTTPVTYGVWDGEMGDDRYSKTLNVNHKLFDKVLQKKLREVVPGEQWPFPPVSVVRPPSGGPNLEDGHHRIETARRLGMRVIPATLVDERAFGHRNPVNTFVEVGEDGVHRVVTPNDTSLPPINVTVPEKTPKRRKDRMHRHGAVRRYTAVPPMGVTVYGRPQGVPDGNASLELTVHHPGGGRQSHRVNLWDTGDQLAHSMVHSGDRTARGALGDWADENAEHFQSIPEQYRKYVGQLIRRGHRYPPEPPTDEPQPVPMSRTRRSTVTRYAAYRAPAGGMVARGTAYKGGEMVPDMESAFMNPSPKPIRKSECAAPPSAPNDKVTTKKFRFDPVKLAALKAKFAQPMVVSYRRGRVRRYGLLSPDDINTFTQQGLDGGQYDSNNTADAVFADRLQDEGDPRHEIVRRDISHRDKTGNSDPNSMFTANHRDAHRLLSPDGTTMPLRKHPERSKYDLPDGTTVTVMPWGPYTRFDNDEDQTATSHEITWDTPKNVYYGAFSPEEKNRIVSGLERELHGNDTPVDEPEYDPPGIPTGGPNSPGGTYYSRRRRVRYGTDHATVDTLLNQLSLPEHNEHRWGLDGPLNGHRGITADALDDVGRGDEAALLRKPNTHVMVHEGRVVPARWSLVTPDGHSSKWGSGDEGVYGGRRVEEPLPSPRTTAGTPEQLTRKVGRVRRYSQDGNSDEDGFHAHLDANPDDHTTRMVFADWLQERGDPRAEGYRALGMLGRKPYMVTIGNVPYDPKLPHRFDNDPNWLSVSHGLPSDWEEANKREYMGRKWYVGGPPQSRRIAEDAAALAFGKLPPERQHELMNTTEKLSRTRLRRHNLFTPT